MNARMILSAVAVALLASCRAMTTAPVPRMASETAPAHGVPRSALRLKDVRGSLRDGVLAITGEVQGDASGGLKLTAYPSAGAGPWAASPGPVLMCGEWGDAVLSVNYQSGTTDTVGVMELRWQGARFRMSMMVGVRVLPWCLDAFDNSSQYVEVRGESSDGTTSPVAAQ